MSGLECLQSNPMEIDLILENIFRFCDVPSLKNCRLVSPKWRKHSINAWRNKAVIQLSPHSSSNFILGFEDFITMTCSEDEDDDPLQLKQHPFKRYSLEIDDWPMDGSKHVVQKGVTAAISTRRPLQLKVLWDCDRFDGFDDCLSLMMILDSLEGLEVIWRPLTGEIPEDIEPFNCPNVKRLKICTRFNDDNYVSEYSLYEYLLQSFPNLEALSVGYGLDENYDDGREYPICLEQRSDIAYLLKNIRSEGGVMRMPLREFEMFDFCHRQKIDEAESREHDIIQALAECQFPLEKLTIHVGWHGGGPRQEEKIIILQLLESCKDTLQYLKCSNNFNDSLCTADYATGSENLRMEVLLEMNLVNGVEWAMFLLDHLDLPKLKKLVVEYDKSRTPCNVSDVAKLFPNWKVFEQLDTFELHDNRKILRGKTVGKFARMMPNLTHLTIPLDKKSFPVVCQHFKGLKTLEVLHGKGDYVEIDDEALTGITNAELEEGGITITARRPNITDLEHLSDLTISCKRMLRREELRITEHSVVHGFLQLPRLFNLSVAIKELSDEMKEKLQNHVKGNLKLQRKQKPGHRLYAFEDEASSAEESACDNSSSDSE